MVQSIVLRHCQFVPQHPHKLLRRRDEFHVPVKGGGLHAHEDAAVRGERVAVCQFCGQLWLSAAEELHQAGIHGWVVVVAEPEGFDDAAHVILRQIEESVGVLGVTVVECLHGLRFPRKAGLRVRVHLAYHVLQEDVHLVLKALLGGLSPLAGRRATGADLHDAAAAFLGIGDCKSMCAAVEGVLSAVGVESAGLFAGAVVEGGNGFRSTCTA